jgi:hypothetical protein
MVTEGYDYMVDAMKGDSNGKDEEGMYDSCFIPTKAYSRLKPKKRKPSPLSELTDGDTTQ